MPQIRTSSLTAFMLCIAVAATADAAQRVALVIGNAAYAEMPLDNPVNDANDMSARLGELGFEVFSATDAGLDSMQDLILEFTGNIEPGSTALVYYAGHGIQAQGKNYLLPVDAELKSERSLRFEAIEMDDILDELERSDSRMNLIILDACRNNPFEQKLRGGGRGLAAVDASAGSLIAYATAPGSVAADGEGANGLYTSALLEVLDEPNLKVEEVFKQVRIRVARESDGQQITWESSSLTADFIFNPVAVSAQATTTTPARDDMQTVANPGICDDLSGNWISRNDATTCDSTMALTRVGKDTYSMDFVACATPVFNKVTGTTVLDGSVMTTRWKGATCSGVTTIELSDDCRTGSGEAVFNPGLVCKGSVRETIHFLDAPP